MQQPPRQLALGCQAYGMGVEWVECIQPSSSVATSTCILTLGQTDYRKQHRRHHHADGRIQKRSQHERICADPLQQRGGSILVSYSKVGQSVKCSSCGLRTATKLPDALDSILLHQRQYLAPCNFKTAPAL